MPLGKLFQDRLKISFWNLGEAIGMRGTYFNIFFTFTSSPYFEGRGETLDFLMEHYIIEDLNST